MRKLSMHDLIGQESTLPKSTLFLPITCRFQLLEHLHRLIAYLLWSRNADMLCYGTSHQPPLCASGRIARGRGECTRVTADDIPKARGNSVVWPFIYLYSVFNINIITLSRDMGDKREGEEAPSTRTVVSRKGREGKGRKLYRKMDGKLEGGKYYHTRIASTVQGACTVPEYIAQLYEWCPHDGSALSWGGRSKVQRG